VWVTVVHRLVTESRKTSMSLGRSLPLTRDQTTSRTSTKSSYGPISAPSEESYPPVCHRSGSSRRCCWPSGSSHGGPWWRTTHVMEGKSTTFPECFLASFFALLPRQLLRRQVHLVYSSSAECDATGREHAFVCTQWRLFAHKLMSYF
jgi:hypothetical protein